MKVLHPSKLEKLKDIKAILFDWDGVFHSGHKNHLGESSFSEADSMGLNLIRLSYYLQTGEIPFTAIITGEHNPTAHFLAEREHLDGIFYNVKDKKVILSYLKENHNISPDEVMFVFDDVLDLSLAREVGVRFMVNRKASRIFQEHVIHNGWVDFVTQCTGEDHVVREIVEFMMYFMNSFKETLHCRINFGEDYQTYWNTRQAILTKKMTISDLQLVSG